MVFGQRHYIVAGSRVFHMQMPSWCSIENTDRPEDYDVLHVRVVADLRHGRVHVGIHASWIDLNDPDASWQTSSNEWTLPPGSARDRSWFPATSLAPDTRSATLVYRNQEN